MEHAVNKVIIKHTHTHTHTHTYTHKHTHTQTYTDTRWQRQPHTHTHTHTRHTTVKTVTSLTCSGRILSLQQSSSSSNLWLSWMLPLSRFTLSFILHRKKETPHSHTSFHLHCIVLHSKCCRSCIDAAGHILFHYIQSVLYLLYNHYLHFTWKTCF